MKKEIDNQMLCKKKKICECECSERGIVKQQHPGRTLQLNSKENCRSY